MVNYSLIKKMNSKNVSMDIDITKKRVKDIWKNITKEQKREAIKVGGFSSSRSFNQVRKLGVISVRMTLAISVAVKINPFYITAEENDKDNYSEEKLILFLSSRKMKWDIETTKANKIKSKLETEFSQIIENVDEETLKNVENLTDEELVTLLGSLFIKEKIENKKEKLLLVKILLIQ